ncbi:hypothetical protein ACFL0L_02330 [Patescibacteria group bacterium]
MREKILAVDIALLPPKELHDIAIQLSKEITQKHPESFALSDERLPHVTLAMAFIDSEKIGMITAKISEVLTRTPALTLKVYSKIAWSDPTSEISLYNTKELQSLHSEMIRVLKPFHTSIDGCREYYVFDEGEKTTKRLLDWPKTYIYKHEQGEICPHITLGSKLPSTQEIEGTSYTFSQAALFQQGNWCTCRKRLHEWNLS